MKRLLALLLAFLSILLLGGQAFAAAGFEQIGLPDAAGKDIPLEIQAETLGNRGDNIVTASGGVNAKWGTWTLSADEVTFDREEQIITASGGVALIDESGNELTCDSLSMKLDDMTGNAEGASFYLPESGYRIKAKDFRWTGPRQFEAEEAVMTTCDGQWPSWYIEVSWVEVEIDGYIYGGNGFLWMEQLPLVYLPYFILPAKVRRQSGFLPPRLGYSDTNGYIVVNKFFWAINESADLLYTLDYRSRKGIKQKARFRYVLADEQEGSLSVSYYNARDDTEDSFDIEADHLSVFSPDTILDIYGDYSENTTTRIDYADNLVARGVSRTESHLYTGHTMAAGTAYGFARYTQPFDQVDDEVLQVAPRAGFMGATTQLWGPLYWKNDSEVTYFERELEDRGSRLTVDQSFALDADLGPLGMSVASGYRQNLYDMTNDEDYSGDSDLAHGAAWGEARAWVGISRNFSGGYYHIIEPRIVYHWEDAGEGDEALPSYDEDDEFGHQSTLSPGIETRLYDPVTGTNVILLDIEKVFDVGKISRRGWQTEYVDPWRGEVELRPWSFLEIIGDGELDTDGGEGWLRWAGESTLTDSRGDSLSIGYQYIKEQARYLEATVGVQLSSALSATYSNHYSREDERILEESVTGTYQHSCWTIVSKYLRTYRDDLDEYEHKVLVTFNLTGLGSAGSLKW